MDSVSIQEEYLPIKLLKRQLTLPGGNVTLGGTEIPIIMIVGITTGVLLLTFINICVFRFYSMIILF